MLERLARGLVFGVPVLCALAGHVIMSTSMSLTSAGFCGIQYPSGWGSPPGESLDEIVSISPFMFAGTVEQVAHELIPEAGSVLRVTFGKVDFADDGITPQGRMEGTPLGWTRSTSGRLVSFFVGVPALQEGSRYVVLAVDWGTARTRALPILGVGKGLFPVREGPQGPYVCDPEGRPLVEIDGRIIGVLDSSFLATARTKATAKKARIEQPTESNSGIPGARPGGRIVEASEAYLPDSLFTKPSVVRGHDGQPIVKIYPKTADPGTRVTEGEFLAAIRELRRGH